MPAALYAPIYFLGVFILSMYLGIKYLNSPGYQLQCKWTNPLPAFVITCTLALWLGFRPISGLYFGDTSNYALSYALSDGTFAGMNWRSEWIWEWLMISCKQLGLTVRWFFLIVECGYMFFTFWAVRRLLPSHTLLALAFLWGSLMFYSFGINGIRNGLACQIVLLAFSYLVDKKYMLGILLCLIAFGIHRSTILPIAAIFVGIGLDREARPAIYFWILCIFLSLLFGSAFENFFASLGFDDRMVSYNTQDVDMDQFSKTGFRWDFLLFSAAPIMLAWYVINEDKSDRIYNILTIAYCLSNAFWLLVIRAPFSNRFAYLSWFMMPLMFAYPLINLAVWEDQDRKTAMILMAYACFTLFMQFAWGTF